MFPPCSNGNYYTVHEGDTLYLLAERFEISLSNLVNANPQIQSATHFVAGQTICIPTSGIKYPCSSILLPSDNTFANAGGIALVRKIWLPYRESTSISIHAYRLPNPQLLGNFDNYEGFAQIPGIISWRFRLYPTPEPDEPTWAGRFDYISATLTPFTRVQIRLSNSITNQLGQVVLHNTLRHCGKEVM